MEGMNGSIPIGGGGIMPCGIGGIIIPCGIPMGGIIPCGIPMDGIRAGGSLIIGGGPIIIFAAIGGLVTLFENIILGLLILLPPILVPLG